MHPTWDRYLKCRCVFWSFYVHVYTSRHTDEFESFAPQQATTAWAQHLFMWYDGTVYVDAYLFSAKSKLDIFFHVNIHRLFWCDFNITNISFFFRHVFVARVAISLFRCTTEPFLSHVRDCVVETSLLVLMNDQRIHKAAKLFRFYHSMHQDKQTQLHLFHF